MNLDDDDVEAELDRDLLVPLGQQLEVVLKELEFLEMVVLDQCVGLLTG